MKVHMPASRFNTGVLSAERESEIPTIAQRQEIFTHAQPMRTQALLLVGDQAMAEKPGPNDFSACPIGHQDLAAFLRATAALPVIQRKALLLTGATRFSQEDAATICGCSGEAILDRADRGRQTLAAMLAPH